MKSIWPWILSGICLMVICWCNLNTYFIKQNTKRIEQLEQYSDTIYVIHSFEK